MKAVEYQILAMRTNDGHGTDRLNSWQQDRIGVQYKGDTIEHEEIDAGGVLNGYNRFGTAAMVVRRKTDAGSSISEINIRDRTQGCKLYHAIWVAHG